MTILFMKFKKAIEIFEQLKFTQKYVWILILISDLSSVRTEQGT